jgi:hypothetical protein
VAPYFAGDEAVPPGVFGFGGALTPAVAAPGSFGAAVAFGAAPEAAALGFAALAAADVSAACTVPASRPMHRAVQATAHDVDVMQILLQ